MVDIAIELFGGPADGIVLSVPAGASSWSVPTPQMTPAEFIALENGAGPSPAVYPTVEHLYVRTPRLGRRTKAVVFTYSGPKRR